MGCCKACIGDAVSESAEGFSEREEAAESLEIVVQLRSGVEISSFTTFPLSLFHFVTLFWYAGFSVFPFHPFFSFSFFSPMCSSVVPSAGLWCLSVCCVCHVGLLVYVVCGPRQAVCLVAGFS